MGGRIEIPRRTRLMAVPPLPLAGWAPAAAVGHAVVLLERSRVPRGLSVAIVSLGIAAVVALAIVALETAVVDQTRSASDRVGAHLRVEDGRTGRSGA